jgi:hypothetical protein
MGLHMNGMGVCHHTKRLSRWVRMGRDGMAEWTDMPNVNMRRYWGTRGATSVHGFTTSLRAAVARNLGLFLRKLVVVSKLLPRNNPVAPNRNNATTHGSRT